MIKSLIDIRIDPAAKIHRALRRFCRRLQDCRPTGIYFGRHPAALPAGAMVFFPYCENTLCCGIAGIVSFKKRPAAGDRVDIGALEQMLERIEARGFKAGPWDDEALARHYLGGGERVETLWEAVQHLKQEAPFCRIFRDPGARPRIAQLATRLGGLLDDEQKQLAEQIGHLAAGSVDVITGRLERLKDIAWCLEVEISANIKKIDALITGGNRPAAATTIKLFRKINAVLNSLDRLEVRGRDSAGLSLLFTLDAAVFEKFEKSLADTNLDARLKERCGRDPLVNNGICLRKNHGPDGRRQVSLAFVYKVAEEVGSLGDNIDYLRRQIAGDPVLQTLAPYGARFDTVAAHTRWASVGAVTEANCHPVDNATLERPAQENGIIHTCLNGDIDNYLELKAEIERAGDCIHSDITTDTKIIPLQIQKYLRRGRSVEEAFRLAVNDFKGSHAISMHTDLAPGKIFLAQRGSGQAIFVGLAPDYFIPASEVYGFVEETPHYLKLDGESIFEGDNGRTQGQIFILDQNCAGGLEGVTAMYYDGTPLPLGRKDIKHTRITSRDIDRQGYPHYFLKEISESPDSVEKTLQNRWKFRVVDGRPRPVIALDESVIPAALARALAQDRIRRIQFIGQGTAGVAALACANILNYYLNSPALQIGALKASEFSGFRISEGDAADSMRDVLVVAISQSGTTTDTNRAVEMVRERGAYTLAIVNRRDSDLTFKVDGVMYTSSGRDIEMSVASTKAFYSQIIAGALVGLYIARLKNRRDDEFVAAEIGRLLEIPAHMRKVLALGDSIRRSAEKLAVTRTYWAAVGSGPNKASADEIRIKLSELCYKTISSDFVEDKKHIDLSSEPLIIVCAAGSRPTVIGDIVKDTAIFKAHRALPIVIADEGEQRFSAYAESVFHVPAVSEHLAPILNTLVGHLWGYYAALAINESSRFLYGFQKDLQNTIADYTARNLDVYEIILEGSFREKILHFYNEFRKKKAARRFPSTIGFDAASDLTLLLKYLSGRLPVSDFELDFNRKGTAVNMLNCLFGCLAESINYLARPVDAIKHQAKTVTVGTSRLSEKMRGILFEALAAENFSLAQLTNTNIIVLKNLQEVIAEIQGSILYRISGLNLLGAPVEETTITVMAKRGKTSRIPSRVESDPRLKGTKRIIVRQGNIYIGQGRKDNRSIVVIPVLSASTAAPSRIEHLLLLHIAFKRQVSLEAKIKALGGKFEHIKNIVQENSIAWDDRFLELVKIEELFGKSAEKIAEFIVSARRAPA